MQFLKVTLNPGSEEELNAILDGMRSTLSCEPIVDANSDTFLQINTPQELLEESFCLGMCFAEIEDAGVENPFYFELVELDEPPINTMVTLN
jgi:hypothetical protein